MKEGIIYMYISPSGKRYIGQTVREMKRKSEHKNNSIKTNTYFGKALRKYGYENFKYEVIIKFRPTLDILKLKRVLDLLETRYVKLYKSNEKEFGYNLNKGGEGNLGYEHSQEIKDSIGKCTSERMKDLEVRKHLSDILVGVLKGPTSEETKQKQSKARKNKKKVYQYNTSLELINEFDSIADAARSINNEATLKTRSNRISECINGKEKSAYNYIWMKE